MSALKCITENLVKVLSQDLDAFLTEVVGFPCVSVVAEEWGNGAQYGFVVSKEPLNDALQSKWLSFKSGNTSPSQYRLPAILNGLCVEGLIEPGNYLIFAGEGNNPLFIDLFIDRQGLWW